MKRSIIFLIFISVFLIMPTSIKADYAIVNSEKGIMVRKGPGTNYESISDGLADKKLVKIIEEVKTTDSCGVWYKIEYNESSDKTGYVCGTFIKVLEMEIDDEFEAILLTFPESYRDKLRILHSLYPNATFKLYEVDLKFNDVVKEESVLGKSLIWDSNNTRNHLKNINSYDPLTNMYYNNYAGGGANWYAASEDVIAYYLDPRNFLDEASIFMFESLSYNEKYHVQSGVEAILKNSFMHDTYVDNKTEYKFSDVIMLTGKNFGISPYYIASRIRQETGSTRSSLVLGTYPSYPEFNGYYNFYNYGAGGTDVVFNGLTYAYNQGWNSEYNAILKGASLIGNSYINVGQDTNYFQKWDVVCKSDYSLLWNECGYYSHQYMQNIEAPYTESKSTFNAYENILGEEIYDAYYVFTIPVYLEMPEVTSLPLNLDKINFLSNITIDNNPIANFDANTLEYNITTSSNNINIQATTVSNKATVKGLGNIDIKSEKQTIEIEVSAENGDILVYKINVTKTLAPKMTLEDTLSKVQANIIDNYIKGITNVDVLLSTFKNANSEVVITVTDKNGNIINSGSLKTGYNVNVKVSDSSKDYKIIIYGDNSGDGEITILDLLLIQKHILKSSLIEQ